jgi:hypothetical protein
MDNHRFCAGCICLTCAHYGGDTSGHCCDRGINLWCPGDEDGLPQVCEEYEEVGK